MTTTDMIDNLAWLEGWAAHERGEAVPWGDHSRIAGWRARKAWVAKCAADEARWAVEDAEAES